MELIAGRSGPAAVVMKTYEIYSIWADAITPPPTTDQPPSSFHPSLDPCTATYVPTEQVLVLGMYKSMCLYQRNAYRSGLRWCDRSPETTRSPRPLPESAGNFNRYNTEIATTPVERRRGWLLSPTSDGLEWPWMPIYATLNVDFYGRSSEEKKVYVVMGTEYRFFRFIG